MRHVLTRFDDIFAAAGQVPLGSTINSVTLMLRIVDSSSDAVDLYRMLGTWSESTATWGNLNLNGDTSGGVQTDDIEAFATAIAIFTAAVTSAFHDIDVTADLLAWSNGAPNHGWAFLPSGTDQVAWESSEAPTPGHRPKLNIDFTAVVVPLPNPVWMGHVGLGLLVVVELVGSCQNAVPSSDQPAPHDLDKLAAGLAQMGQFIAAVKTASQALAVRKGQAPH